MPDREKIIQGIQECNLNGGRIGNCPYKGIIDLLKEQEAVKPVITPWAVNEDGEVEIAKRECGKCGWQFFTEKPNYCENCGAPILWESR